MGRGNSCGGGQSQLGYLFGTGGEAPAPMPTAPETNNETPPKPAAAPAAAPAPAPVPAPASELEDATKQIPAGINGISVNNYMRADGQNTGNFLTDRPSTKVHAAPGGGSSLDYLFSGNK